MSGAVSSCKQQQQHHHRQLCHTLLVRLQVGVVSDYDLLALDQLGQTKDDRQLFPQADETWQVCVCWGEGVPSLVMHCGPYA